jgi:hypothetical protein
MLALVLPNFNQTAVAAQSTIAASSSLQSTPTPQAEDVSVIGSTDGILIMGIVIVLIVTLPLLFHKKRK